MVNAPNQSRFGCLCSSLPRPASVEGRVPYSCRKDLAVRLPIWLSSCMASLAQDSDSSNCRTPGSREPGVSVRNDAFLSVCEANHTLLTPGSERTLHLSTARRITNVVPFLGVDVTYILAPWSSTIRCTTLNPSPVPVSLVEKNGS